MSRFLWLVLLLCVSPAWAGPLVQFRTVYGDIDVELFEDKPVTTANFLRYVKSGFYQDMFFHRLLPNFVIQAGGYVVGFRHTTNATLYSVPSFPAITNEYLVGHRASNLFGTIAMAKLDGDPNSATSEFFFNLTNNAASLDNQNGGFTVFGKALRGTNVLKRFNFPTASTNHITIDNYGPPFDTIPFTAPTETFDDLIYVDVSLLNVQVKLGTGKQREISWVSVAGRSNFVEYTFLTNMPPKWFPIATNMGNGTTNKVIDASPSNTNRFYRVRVDYPTAPLP